MSASSDCKSELQVLCCKSCLEALNHSWFYDETIGVHGDPNPYRGRCRNCGSRDFAVGVIPAVRVIKLANEGYKLIPHMEPTDVKDPFLKENIFDMGRNHVFQG